MPGVLFMCSQKVGANTMNNCGLLGYSRGYIDGMYNLIYSQLLKVMRLTNYIMGDGHQL